MRRRTELAKKLRVKIMGDRRNGLTYEEIQQKRGVSSRTIADLVKGTDLRRFCQQCGETDPEKLEMHHPDRTNFPDDTITLCASCHSKVTREQQRQTNRGKKNRQIGREIPPFVSLSTAQDSPTLPQRTAATPDSLPRRPPVSPGKRDSSLVCQVRLEEQLLVSM
jgi:phage terminase large subunit GpA-like protein